MQSITVGSNNYNLVTIPASAKMAAISFVMSDTVAAVGSPFTLQEQTQYWTGGDRWSGRLTLPPMKGPDAAPWKAFLAELHGIANVFQLGDPDGRAPAGSALGVPIVTGTNVAGGAQLATSGWTASQYRVLLPGDYLQVGYRLYMVVDSPVNSDFQGNATINLWPSLREVPAANAPLILAQPKGLFRLAKNDRGWSASPRRATTISFEFEEVR